MADPDARRRAEDALRRVLANAAAIVRLSWSDGATPSDRANLERIKSAAADIAQDHKILRAENERLQKALKEIADGDHGEYCGLRNQMLVAGGKTECYADCPKRGAAEALATPKGA